MLQRMVAKETGKGKQTQKGLIIITMLYLRRRKMIRKVSTNLLQKTLEWVQQETITLKSKFESRFIKTVRTVVVLACVLTFINVILVLKG